MRRRALHIAAALLAFTVGFLTADGYENLAYALPLSLLAFLIAEVLPRLEVDFHFLMVVAMSLLLWAAGASAFLSHFSYAGGSCVVDFTGEGDGAPAQLNGGAQPASADKPPSETSNYPCGGADVSPPAINSMWVGAVDKKALAKPRPQHPPLAKAARAAGAVAVWVLVDESGRVLWSQAISGHPLLRRPAMNAACLARFSPPLVNGPPIRVSGILTYNF